MNEEVENKSFEIHHFARKQITQWMTMQYQQSLYEFLEFTAMHITSPSQIVDIIDIFQFLDESNKELKNFNIDIENQDENEDSKNNNNTEITS